MHGMRRPERTVLPAALLAVAAASAAMALAVARRAAPVAGHPLGPDGGLWLVAARVRAAGGHVDLPPLWPDLVALLGAGSMPAIHVACLAVAAVASAGAAALVARRPASAALGALVAGAAALLGTRVYAFAWQAQPDLLAAATLSLAALAGASFARRPGAASALLLGVAAGLAAASREHGIAVAAAAAALVLLPGAPARRRLLRAAALVAGLQVASGATTDAPWRPFLLDHPTAHKAAVALQHAAEMEAGTLSPAEAPPDMGDETRTAARGAGLLREMPARAWAVSAPEHPLLATSLAALLAVALAGRPLAALALAAPSLVPLGAGLLVWTQWRHYAVAGPAAAAAVGAAVAVLHERAARPGRAAALVLLVLAALGGVGLRAFRAGADRVARGAEAELAALAPARAAAAWIAARAEPGDLFAGDAKVGFYAGLPPAPVHPGAPAAPAAWPDVAWRTWVVARHGVDPRPPWRLVHTEGPYRVFRAEAPAGVPRRCLAGRLLAPPGDDYPRFSAGLPLAPAEGCAAPYSSSAGAKSTRKMLP